MLTFNEYWRVINYVGVADRRASEMQAKWKATKYPLYPAYTLFRLRRNHCGMFWDTSVENRHSWRRIWLLVSALWSPEGLQSKNPICLTLMKREIAHTPRWSVTQARLFVQTLAIQLSSTTKYSLAIPAVMLRCFQAILPSWWLIKFAIMFIYSSALRPLSCCLSRHSWPPSCMLCPATKHTLSSSHSTHMTDSLLSPHFCSIHHRSSRSNMCGPN